MQGSKEGKKRGAARSLNASLFELHLLLKSGNNNYTIFTEKKKGKRQPGREAASIELLQFNMNCFWRIVPN